MLLSIAIVGDVLAIVIIALLYASDLSVAWLAGAVGCATVVVVMRRWATTPWWYVVPGLALWWCMHQPGVHATIAGVVLGLLTPARPIRGRDVRAQVEDALHGWSAFVVVPVFARTQASWSAPSSGILAGSLVSAVLGVAVLLRAAGSHGTRT